MMVALLIAGIGLLLAGLLTVVSGILIDLSLGNTLIFAGAITACTGIIMLGIWMVVRELKNIGRQLGNGVPARADDAQPAGAAPRDQASASDGFPFGHDQPAPENAGNAAAPAPWQDEAASRDRALSPSEPAAPAVKPKRNLLFSSSSRKERERAEARANEPSAAGLLPSSLAPPSFAPPPPAPVEAPAVTFDDAWPQSERARTSDAPPPRRSPRAPSTFTEPNAGITGTDRYPPAARGEEQPPVTVLKSGVVDGMAYSLYSDGSIEAQMPEGMMRFASIDELRSHLDQRP